METDEKSACEKCGGAQFFLVKTDEKRAGIGVPCECVPLDIRAGLAGIPERYRSAAFENFDPMEGKTDALTAALEWDGKRPLVLYGLWGTGKTHLACAMGIREIKRGRPVMFVDVRGYLDAIKARFGTDQVEAYSQRIGDFGGVLVLDDLGAEQDTEWAEAQLRALLNYRYSRRLTTIITTNLGHSEVRERMGGAVASRLSEWQWVLLGGVDVRPMLAEA